MKMCGIVEVLRQAFITSTLRRTSGKGAPVCLPVGYKAGWVPEPIWTFSRREHSLPLPLLEMEFLPSGHNLIFTLNEVPLYCSYSSSSLTSSSSSSSSSYYYYYYYYYYYCCCCCCCYYYYYYI
jgi:hypothetical protein